MPMTNRHVVCTDRLDSPISLGPELLFTRDTLLTVMDEDHSRRIQLEAQSVASENATVFYSSRKIDL